ncbi:MAG: NAD-dependent epimerase/dehydratase family protein [Frankiales bacterium]|nr:NAD-dependent epimerase/dehydratase family protein [Frankiales bacterium]
MARPPSAVRPRRSRLTIAVTGAAGPLGGRLLTRLAAEKPRPQLVGLDTDVARVAGVDWRRCDVRDPTLRRCLEGVDVVVQLAIDRRADAALDERRTVNVKGTDNLLRAARAAGCRRVVLLTSAMVYGALPDNAVPLVEDSPLRAEADESLVGDWLEMERLAQLADDDAGGFEVVVVRPASLVGEVSDSMLPRLLEAPRLLAIRDAPAHWQLCHVDDAVEALAWAALGKVDGPLTVGCHGWLTQAEVERLSGLRSLVVPKAVAISTAERLHRVGVLPAPASELHYLAHPWVVGSERLVAAGWEPRWDNASALRDHLDRLGDRVGRSGTIGRKGATRAAAGATVAVVGTVAIARARARRRRRG